MNSYRLFFGIEESEKLTTFPEIKSFHFSESRDDSAREPKDVTREPKGRKGGRKSRKDEDATTEAPQGDLELRRNLGGKGNRRGGRKSDGDSNLVETRDLNETSSFEALGNQKTPLLNHVSEVTKL